MDERMALSVLAERAAVNDDRPRVGFEERADDVDGRGLARAVGAEEGEDFTALHIEVQPLDRVDGAVGLLQAGHFDDVFIVLQEAAPR